MSKNNIRGRSKILIISCILLISSIIDFTNSFIFYEETDIILETSMSFFKFIFSCFICYKLYLGKKWSLVALESLLKIAIAISFLAILIGVINIKFAILGSIFMMLYSIALYLLFSKDTKLYCKDES